MTPCAADRFLHAMLRLLLVPCLLVTAPAIAIERAGLSVARVQGQGWLLEGISLQVDLARGTGEVRVSRLVMPPPVGELQQLTIQCRPLRVDAKALDCPNAKFQVTGAGLDQPDFTGSFRYVFGSQQLQVQADDLPLGGTRLRASVRQEGGQWQALLDAPQLSMSSEDGRFASDKLALKVKLAAWPVENVWHFDLGFEAPGGQAYLEPVFMDFAQSPLQAEGRGHWAGDTRQLVLDSFQVRQPGSLMAQGSMKLDFAMPKPLQDLQVKLDEAVLPGVYTRYLQPFLIGTVMDSLETQGRIRGSIGFSDGRAQHIRLSLTDLHLDDSKKRFAFYGLNGAVNWQASTEHVPAAARTTTLRWAGGNAYRLDLGPSELQLETQAGGLRLLEPTRLSVLDGALSVRRFEVMAAGTPDMSVAFDGELQPIGMEGMCRALGWPVFGGTVSGSIPTLEYRDGNLTVGGTLSANVFDGRVEVEKLRLDQPFGSLPRLSADMKLRRIDLKAATSAFSFGRIEGRLDGDVRNLRLLKWKPVAFDGRLYSSADDDTRHRISQRAIENISDLGGGGAAGVLSRGFLRFFEDFAYDRIALGCRLQDGICHMTGLEPHRGGGYYIVKGSLLPRIDVIGFANRVSWSGFVEQLKSATQSEGPVVR